jgi:hypothetical protein
MEALIEHDGINVWTLISTRLAPITGLFRRAFGCWHLQMSLPFTRDSETYRTCVSCGARRRFDLDQWAMVGDFYHPQRQPALYVRGANRSEVVRLEIKHLNGERTICHCK